ncbi:MAG: SEC-C domain-containing protein [Acidobacteriota bacterium]|nr:MAG: SEC-C domain-containing protein [Acidobacteriota bacterium]
MAAKKKSNTRVIWPGFSNKPPPRHIIKVGRNDRCPCGSGKKYKDCHEEEGTAFLERLALERDKERLRERRQRLKEAGVPWYRRLFGRS